MHQVVFVYIYFMACWQLDLRTPTSCLEELQSKQEVEKMELQLMAKQVRQQTAN